jgi:hypothetical protein
MTTEQQAAVREAVRAALHYADNIDDATDAVMAAHLKALEATGYAVVPIEPIAEMDNAGARITGISPGMANAAYRAMISVRPR